MGNHDHFFLAQDTFAASSGIVVFRYRRYSIARTGTNGFCGSENYNQDHIYLRRHTLKVVGSLALYALPSSQRNALALWNCCKL